MKLVPIVNNQRGREGERERERVEIGDGVR